MHTYSDLNMFYQHSIGPQGIRVYDADAIINSILTLLLTTKGEMFFAPSIGADIDNFLFEPIDEITAKRLQVALLSQIEEVDNRVRVDWANSSVIPDADNQFYDVALAFHVRGVDAQEFEHKFKIVMTGGGWIFS